MSKIGVALALCVLLLGAVLIVGDGVATQVVDRGRDIGTALTNGNLGVDNATGAVNSTTP
ncbi:hypothetical protein FE782_11305 [Paenibacillus antri]|uniref:Uncharacterized protein n=1 Tax=Paenibacillus antri TaxID=2582848 RepID=A0A5R9GGU8_9BACL|nr:hypothetical protein [Paenibacillus antri]TLS51963.1 hypothetical protein FE782_11305 [Paenibacillus antri]